MSKLLIVDDNHDNLKIFTGLVNTHMPELEVITADSGPGGLRKAASELPDAILLDVVMPDMDGFEVCKRLKQKQVTKPIPIIFITGIMTDSEAKIKGLEYGGDAYLTKPIHAEELIAQVTVILRIKKAEDELRQEKELLEDRVTRQVKEIQESEEKWRSLVDNAPNTIMISDSEDKITFINQIVPGLTADEVIGSKIYDFIDPEYHDLVREKNSNLFKTGNPDVYEIQGIGSAGETAWYETHIGPILKDGKVTAITSIARDITERKRAEEALQESEERYDLAVKATKDGIWDWNILTNEQYYSPRWCEILGYSHDDPELPHVYDSWASRIHRDDYKRVVKALKAHLEEGRIYDVDYRHRYKSGEYRWQNARGQVIFDENGKPYRMVGTISDINQRMQDAKLIHDKNVFLTNIIESLPHPFFVIKVKNYSIELFNTACGFDKVNGKSTCYSLTYSSAKPCQGENHICPLDIIKITKKSTQVLHYHVGEDGNRKIHEVHGYPIFDSNGELIQMIIYSIDVTDRKKVEHELEKVALLDKRRVKELERSYANIEKSQAASINLMEDLSQEIEERKNVEAEISKQRTDLRELSTQIINAQEAERKRISQELHDEMGQYLTTLNFNLEEMREKVTLKEPAEIIEKLDETITILNETEDKVHELSLELRPLMLDELGLISTVRWYLNKTIRKYDIQIDFETIRMEKRLDINIETTIFRIVQELVTNIIRYAQAKRVRIQLKRNPKSASLLVKDDGIGFNLQAVLNRKIEDRGIGLIGIQERVSGLNGNIKIQTNPGKGTKIIITVPVKD